MITQRISPAAQRLAMMAILLSGAGGCFVPRQSAVAVWIVDGGEPLTHQTPPSPENDIFSATRSTLRLTAALNETLAFQIALRTTAPPAGPFDVRLSDLTSDRNRLPASDVFQTFRVQDVRIERFPSWFPAHSGQPATPTLVPDLLIPWDAPRGGGPIPLAETRNEIIWVDLHVPPTTSAGRYRGQLTVANEATRQAALVCAIDLEVIPAALPGPRSLPVVCRVDPGNLLTTHLRWPEVPAEQNRLLPAMPAHFTAVRLVNATMQLLQAHRTNPVLWVSFPKFRLVGQRSLTMQWEDYDRLVQPFLDGSAFPDRVRLEWWPLPASIHYPNPELTDGIRSPRYARILAAYLAECRQHFEQRGWLDRAFLRLCPPQPLSPGAVDLAQRVAAILRQSETTVPLVAHMPGDSLRGLGWHDAPPVQHIEAQILAPPAMWFEPEAMRRQRNLTRETWFIPDRPPYSGSLKSGAPATDPWVLPWLAYRYDARGIWIEHPLASTDAANAPDALLHPGEPYGLREQGPIASVRLKRLRRGLQDYELLKLLETNGERLLAQRLAQQVVLWAFTDACRENLLSTRDAGWPLDPAILRRVRLLMLRELAAAFAPDETVRRQQLASLSDWALMFNQAERVNVTVDGVRLAGEPGDQHALIMGSVSNGTARDIDGTWRMATAPSGWQLARPTDIHVPAQAQRPFRVRLDIDAISYNTDGVYPFDVTFDTRTLGAFARGVRLPVAACPRVSRPPRVDGKLDDWPLATNNAAADFRLCSGRVAGRNEPTLPTRAFFCMDRERFYVAIRCALRPGEPPTWSADNAVPIDGAMPWGQDVVEVLIDPRPTTEGTSSDLYCLQIKPSGLLVAHHGCRTDPPVGTSEPWWSHTRAAVEITREAWVVELAIPFDAFHSEQRRHSLWGLNVTRLDARRGEYASWSGARGHCYSPQTLGNLIMLWR
jgi:hypothetical protein